MLWVMQVYMRKNEITANKQAPITQFFKHFKHNCTRNNSGPL